MQVWHPYFYQLEQRLKELQQFVDEQKSRNEKLELMVEALEQQKQEWSEQRRWLEGQVERLEGIKPIRIEAINYKIQELTVKELSGTLNIGMTALSDPEEIGKWFNGKQEQSTEDTPGEQAVQLDDLASTQKGVGE